MFIIHSLQCRCEKSKPLVRRFASLGEERIVVIRLCYEKKFYSPAQAVKCVVHTAYPHITKHCILTIAVNSTLPKSVCTIESTVTVERSTSFSLLAPVPERREEARCCSVRQSQTALQRFLGSHRDDGRVSRQVRGGRDLSHGRRLHDALPPLQTRSLCASAMLVWSLPADPRTQATDAFCEARNRDRPTGGGNSSGLCELCPWKKFQRPTISYGTDKGYRIETLLGRVDQPETEILANLRAIIVRL